MMHKQISIKEQYGEDVARLFEDIKNARNVKEVEGILNEFIKQNWRDKEFHSKVGGITDLISREGRQGNLGITSVAYYGAVPELAKTLSGLNSSLRNAIEEGRKKPGMEKMTADAFEKADPVKNYKGQLKSPREFVGEDLLSNDHKANDALRELRHGAFGPSNMSELMKELDFRYKGSSGEDAVRILGLMRSINANLASEYQELRGKLDSQESFRNLNVLK
jgi:hypothetical protein